MSKIKFYHYSSKSQLDGDITSGEIENSDIVFVDDDDSGTLIWTHGKYYSLSETEFKNFLDLYTSEDIVVGSYLIATTDSSIEDTDSVNDALGKLEYKIQQLEAKSSGEESATTYKFILNEDGVLSCLKNGTEEGFELSEDGVLSLKE